MEKYTVDLDKVLNDFEFSEYSIESAKLNNNRHENDLPPHTSSSTMYSSRNETTVKHSINNVFHSLNEYLNTEITPKKLENVTKIPQNGQTFYRNSEHTEPYNPEVLTHLEEMDEEIVEKVIEEKTDIPCVQDETKDEVEDAEEGITLKEENVEILIELNAEDKTDNIPEILTLSLDETQTNTLTTESSIEEKLEVEHTEEIHTETQEIEKPKEIGFTDNIELDEENIDHYFEALEQELGKEIEEETKVEIPTTVIEETKPEEIEMSEVPNVEQTESVENKSEISNIQTEETITVVQEIEQQDAEIEKTARPQNLTIPIEEDTDEKPRKISLVGEPGSTPYNNVYSTDFNDKLKEAGAGDATSVRPVSPTYSDISTDSVSSHSDMEHKETPVQDNSITSSETGRNDEGEIQEERNENLTQTEGATASLIEDNVHSFSSIDWLGKQAPLWIPDNEATSCLHCDMKFTVIKRRHHCRACGLVLCSKCCNLKYRLEYLNDEARVCVKCYEILNKDNVSLDSDRSQEISPSRSLDTTGLGQPNPNNPLEYCSMVSPLQQVDLNTPVATPSVMVPVGVLKRNGSNKGRSNKSVMFCDGIRPGSDLTNLDSDFNYSDNRHNKGDKSKKLMVKNLDFFDRETRSFIPSDVKNLPPTVAIFKTDIKYTECSNDESLIEILTNETLIFALHSNVYVHVKIVNMECCINRTAWCFSTEGLINVGQDEIVILLEMSKNETLIPREIFTHLNNIYQEALKGSSVKELGLSLHQTSPFLGSKNHAGFVYIRPTYQCLQNVLVPKEPYLVGILIHRWETPWAKLFPLRLVLRLGAEYKYYPSPIISTRERDSVFVEVGHTIINLLADFRNFTYTLPQIRGLTIHMEDKNTTVTIPVNRYDQVLKGLSNSSDHILAFAGNFSTNADSHLVCIQDTTQGAMNNYSTHAINIANQPRKITGASFIVFNGALKSTSGLTAKSNIVEDGLMIQILPEHMLQVRESLKNMKNHVIKCGCVNEESDETVTIIWGESDTSFNVGVLSPIDNKIMTGVPSIRVHNGKDYACNSGNRLIRWTEVFIIQNGDERNQETVDISKISESVAKATCQALVKYLELLVSNSFYKIGLRVNLHVENVSYSAGSNNVKLPPIYMKSLDNELIPVLHRITSNNVTEQPIILELIFRILNV